ncbi:hypothetical protein ASD00_03535 [Ensifer sp. Root31]|nr:hypothetical protein ASD00_03535 [Ensifer sp. Root31]
MIKIIGVAPPSGHCAAWPKVAALCRPDRGPFMATLIMTAKFNDIDPQAWLADVLAHIADMPISRLEHLPPGRRRRWPLRRMATS